MARLDNNNNMTDPRKYFHLDSENIIRPLQGSKDPSSVKGAIRVLREGRGGAKATQNQLPSIHLLLTHPSTHLSIYCCDLVHFISQNTPVLYILRAVPFYFLCALYFKRISVSSFYNYVHENQETLFRGACVTAINLLSTHPSVHPHTVSA